MAVRINRVYTKVGDGGQTALVGGRKVSKADARVESYGEVDELNATIGWVRANLSAPFPKEASQKLDAILERVQNELFNLGSLLATRPEDLRPSQPRIEERHITKLEQDLDGINDFLPELTSFVLPGGGTVGAALHLSRTVCRRAERRVVALAAQDQVPGEAIRYLNRLSDALFVFARWAAVQANVPEVLWKPEET